MSSTNETLFLGYLGPSGLYNNNETLGVDCVGGAAGYIDRQFFGINHIYSNPTSKAVYESGAFDPEGLLGKLKNGSIIKVTSKSGFHKVHSI